MDKITTKATQQSSYPNDKLTKRNLHYGHLTVIL